MKIFLAFFLVVTVIILAVTLQTSKLLFNSKATDSPQPYTLGPEEVVFQSDQNYTPDYPYFTFKSNDGLRGVISVGELPLIERAFEVKDPSTSKLGMLKPMVGTIRGTNETYLDFRGVWMNGTYRQPNSNVINGIYHAEENNAEAEDKTLYTVAYIQSNDGGKTWVKPNYPNNFLITGYSPPGKVGGADPYSLVEVGDYVYLYYFEHTGNHETRGMAVARAPKSGIPNAASWEKYFCNTDGRCNFKQPGLGGNFTKLPGLDGQSWVSQNTFLNKFIAIDGNPLSSSNKVQLKTSTNGISFENFGAPIDVGNTYGLNWKKVYVSLVNIDGTTGQTGKEFYIYYVVLNRDPVTGAPTQHKTRYLARRKVSIQNTSWTPPTVEGLANVKRFYSSTKGAHMYETPFSRAVKDDPSWTDEGPRFKINEVQEKAMLPLYRVTNSTDVFLETDPSQIDIAVKAGFANKQILGYCSKTQNANTYPLYRFYNPAQTDHFYTIEEPEKQLLEKNPAWKFEGTLCYVYKFGP